MQKLRAVIAQLRTAPMTKDDVSMLLDCSPSGARKYLNDLLAASLVEVSVINHMSCRTYRLVADLDLIDEFLIQEAPLPKRGPSKRATALEKAMQDGNRHFHVMQDDTFFGVRLRHAAVAPDPLALPREFFSRKDRPGIPAAIKAEVARERGPAFAGLDVHFARRAPGAPA
jgi:hypothetical protein